MSVSHGRMKAQFSEMLAFMFLVIFVTFFIVFIRLSTLPGLSATLNAAVEAHESKYLMSGVNVVFFSTEPKSGKPLMEMLGLAAYVGNKTIDMGRYIGTVDISEEIAKRMDAVFGKGKWSMEVDFPETVPEFQIVIVADTSGSMCNDIVDLRDKLPEILSNLKKAGRKAEVTVYMLPSPSGCCVDGEEVTISCTGLGFPDKEEFNCETVNSAEKLRCQLQSSNAQTSEDWGNGLACAVQHGPRGGWKDGTIRIGIPLSDELSLGSECGCTDASCKSGLDSLQAAILEAGKNDVKIFPLRAYPCGTVCYPAPTCANQQCSELNKRTYCSCGDTLLIDWMTRLASQTGGTMYNLTDSGGTAEKINDIVSSMQVERISYLQLGTTLDLPRSQGKRIRSWDFTLPVSYSGKYTVAHVYAWQ